MPLNSQTANAAASAFMQGFSFVDDINARKTRDARLAARLKLEDDDRKFRRGRLEDQDAQNLEDRTKRLALEERMKEVNRILADPDATPEQLEPFTDIPEVMAIVRGQRTDTRDRADLESISATRGLTGAVGAQQQVPAAVDPADPGGLTGAVAPAELPADPGSPEALTDRELNAVAISDPAGAAQIRDEQKAEAKRQRDAKQAAGGFAGSGVVEQTQAQKDEVKRKAGLDQLNTDWDAFNDINNVAGDALRQLNPTILTAMYFDDRGSIDDDQTRDDLDEKMAPHIQSTITEQQGVLTGLDQQTPEARNARRKLGEAYGLANEIGIEYEPLRQNGVDGRGLPINGANQALADTVVNAVQDAPGTSLPPNPNMTRADQTLLLRGTTGRVSERLAQAAFRQYKNGRINFTQYDSLIRTGRLPQKPVEWEQTDPTKDTWRVDPNTGHRQLIIPARHVPTAKELAAKSRNLINEEGLAHIRTLERAYNTKDDETRGTKLTNAFITALASNEQRATRGGYDLSTVNDVGLLYQRWLDLHVFRDAYNDEWIINGRANPDFTEDYGTMPEVLFNQKVDQSAATGELEIPGTTTLGFGGQSPAITPLKPRNPAVYDAIRVQFPEFAQSSDDEIEAKILEQEQ